MASSNRQATAEGQWRLARIELYNWGTFHGYHVIDVSRDGLLLTGASGSGKSTIVDAISTVMAPKAKLSYNAAASNGGRRDAGRNYNNYVRGAWGHASDSAGGTTKKFLRPKEATWSGIMLRFEDGVPTEGMGPAQASRHDAVNLAALFFQKRNSVSDDDIKRFYAVIRGACALSELEPYGRNGADMAAFNKAYRPRGGQAWSSQPAFFQRFCSIMRISGPQTLTLLQKTQAAKNIGSLDDLFRRYMLEEPQTFSQADAAVEQFEELENAHRGVVRQREQMEMLAPLDGYDRDYTAQREAERRAAELKEACTPFAETLIVEVIDAQIREAEEKGSLLKEEVAACKSAYAHAKQSYESAAAILAEKGGVALSSASFDVLQRQKELQSVTASRANLNRALGNIGFDELPLMFHEFEALKRAVRESARAEEEWFERHEADKVRMYGELDSTNRKIEDIENELRHLRSVQSNIPVKLHELRCDIAAHMGLSLSEVPFVGELIDVKPEEAAWQGAIERLLRNCAQTMLVEKRYAPAITEYLESRHLGLRFEFDGVPEEVEVPKKNLHAKSLVRKVSVQMRAGNENLSLWVNRLLRNNYDYICVDEPRQMADYSHALTRAGQVKAGNHHVKDDRTHIADRKRWLLGSTNDAKIDQLEHDRDSLKQQLAQASRHAKEFEARQQRAQLLSLLAEELESKSWDDIDLQTAETELAKARAFHESLLQNDDYKQAQAQCDEALKARESAEGQLRSAQVRLDKNESVLQDLAGKREEHLQRFAQLTAAGAGAGAGEEGASPGTESRGVRAGSPSATAPVRQGSVPTEAQALQLRTAFKRADAHYQDSITAVYQTMGDVTRRLDREIAKAARAQQDAWRNSELIMQQYKDAFKAEAANLTTNFEDREGYIARYRQIKSTGLAKYEGKFLEVLTDFSQDQITVIATEIRNAFRNVRDRLEPVNRSLLLSPFAPGIHLQIEVREARSARVDRFLADLRDIASGSWETGDLQEAEQRYERTAALMRRLKSTERADREWRRECLNTPDHMKFIAKEIDVDGSVVNVHSNDEGLSGGQKQKLVFFCLAAALRYQLSEDEAQVPSYGTIVLDEAFDKSDRHFAEEALNIFKAFKFHMVLATPGKLLQTIEGHVGGVVLVTCEDGRHSRLSPVIFEDAQEAAE